MTCITLRVISLDCPADAQTLRLGQADEEEPEEEDPFSAKLMTFDVSIDHLESGDIVKVFTRLISIQTFFCYLFLKELWILNLANNVTKLAS